MVLTSGFFVDNLSKFLLRHIGQTRWVPLQNLQNLPDLLLPPLEFSREVVKPRRKILDSKWKGEVKGEGEDNDDEDCLKENAGEEKAIIF